MQDGIRAIWEFLKPTLCSLYRYILKRLVYLAVVTVSTGLFTYGGLVFFARFRNDLHVPLSLQVGSTLALAIGGLSLMLGVVVALWDHHRYGAA